MGGPTITICSNNVNDRTQKGKMWAWNAKKQTDEYVGDGTPKLFVNLGRATVSWGFKYDKGDSDDDMLVVDLDPGD